MIIGRFRPFKKEKVIDMGDFLREHWIEIKQRTAQPFCYKILNNFDFVQDAKPPSSATIVVRKMNPTLEHDFFKLVQRPLYVENKDMNQI